MELRLGARIASLRRAAGMTQEMLANAVGVSAAAVSKWEHDASCPDIALLCPLARALCVNVDTLLAFEQTLSREQIAKIIAQIVTLARSGDFEAAHGQITRALRTYPGNCELRLNLAAAYSVLEMSDAPQRERWQQEKRTLYESVHQNGTDALRQAAASALASIALSQDRLADAQRYLDEIPEYHEETIVQRVQLCRKQGEMGKARDIVQKRLYAALTQANMCLTLLCDLQPDAQSALCTVRAMEELERVFGIGGGYSAGLSMQQYVKQGRKEDALASLAKLVEAMTDPVMEPNPALFAPGIAVRSVRKAARELREAALKSLETDQEFAFLREEEAFKAAVWKLKASMKQDE